MYEVGGKINYNFRLEERNKFHFNMWKNNLQLSSLCMCGKKITISVG